MPPEEHTSLLLAHNTNNPSPISDEEVDALYESGWSPDEIQNETLKKTARRCLAVLAILMAGVTTVIVSKRKRPLPTGPYQLVELQEGSNFFNYYTFFDGPDSLGSAGYNIYASKKRATELGIAKTVLDPVTEKQHIIMKSKKTHNGPRESVRLEGNRRFDHGLFILDLSHVPVGCGVWPAFWLTDESHWPHNGEIDIVEGINRQSTVKTALHTSDHCSMYAHVPAWAWTGKWDTATGLPDTFTGEPNFENRVQADNCWVMAAHQWANQGCVAVDRRNNTLGVPLNNGGGGIYALEWDPVNHYIRSWAFPREDGIPENLQTAMDTASSLKESSRVAPNTTKWGAPYAYFAIGETTGCSADHFKNMRVVINLAFCGTVAGNRFSNDCPELADFLKANETGSGNPWATCNAYIESDPESLEDAYWEIRGAYVYQRSY